MNKYYRTDEQCEEFLKSIGGVFYVYRIDAKPEYSRHVLSVSNGWLGIIEEMITDLIKLGWNKRILQVKEKFGGLRFYVEEGNEDIWKRISEAEQLSYTVCEICGEPGEIRTDIGWYLTLCEKHYNEKKNK